MFSHINSFFFLSRKIKFSRSRISFGAAISEILFSEFGSGSPRHVKNLEDERHARDRNARPGEVKGRYGESREESA